MTQLPVDEAARPSRQHAGPLTHDRRPSVRPVEQRRSPEQHSRSAEHTRSAEHARPAERLPRWWAAVGDRRPQVGDPNPHTTVAEAEAGAPEDLVSALATPDVPVHRPNSRPAWRAWQRPYIARLVLGDALTALFGTVVAAGASSAAGTLSLERDAVLAPLYVAAWILVLAVGGSYETRRLGVGPVEFNRVLRSGIGVFALVAAADVVLGRSMGRPAVLAVAITIAFTMVERLILRRRLHQARWRGHYIDRVIAVGPAGAVAHIAATLRREAHHGLEVVGACILDGDGRSSGSRVDGIEDTLGVPVFGGLAEVPAAVAATGSQVVAIAASGDLATGTLRRLAWSLEGLGTEVLVSPGLVEVAGPRLTVRPYPSLPLLHVEQPRLSGSARAVKGFGDRFGAGLLLLVLSPLFAVVAVLIATTSPGGVFFKQTRIGLDGRPFRLWKFRSMVSDAESLVAGLGEQNEKDDVLFKIRRDPRITRVGVVLRRLSLDELPQLLNVVTGSMSLVGPRPPLPREVEQYATDARRRLLVRPGITGLWQVSGRSELSWEETVRLDLRYVENWTVGLDVSILYRTLHAVVGGRGAY